MIIGTHTQLGKSDKKTSRICDYLNTYSTWQKRHKNIRNYVIIGAHTQLGKSDTRASEIWDYWNTYSIWQKRHENIRICDYWNTYSIWQKGHESIRNYVIIGTHTQFGKSDTKTSEIL